MDKYKELTNSMQTRVYRERLEERIDLARGNIVFDHTDFELGGELMPVSIHHVYNSKLSNDYYTSNASIGLYTADFSAMKLGLGWRLNIMQSMMGKRDSVNGEVKQTYIHVNEIGNQIVFSKTENANEYVSSEDSSVIYDDLTNTITDGDLRYVFEQNKLVEIHDVKKNASITIFYEEGKITKVSDGVGREFNFCYNENNYLTTIIAPDNLCIVFSYDTVLIKGFQYGRVLEDNTTTLYPDKKISFSYDKSYSSPPYVKYQIEGVDFYDENGNVNFRKTYAFDTGKLSKVQEYKDFDSVNVDGILDYKESHLYSTNFGCVAVDCKEEGVWQVTIPTYYSFDENGNLISKYCEIYPDKNVEMTLDLDPVNPLSENGDRFIIAHQNLVMNSELCQDIAWSIKTNDTIGETDSLYVSESYVNEKHISTDEKNAAYARNSLIMNSYTPSLREVGYSQTRIFSAGTYTFSAYVKTEIPFECTEDNCGVYLSVVAQDGKSFGVSESVRDSENGFVRISTTFTLLKNETISMQILMNGKGKAYVSAPQAEEDNCANEFNMFENGSVSYSMDWIGSAVVDYDNGFTSVPCLKIQGTSGYNKYMYKRVYPKSAKNVRESFVFSAWAKATRFSDSSSSRARLRAVINYSDTTNEEFTKDLMTGITAWQKVELSFEKTRYEEISYIDLFVDYDYQTGIVYVDDLALIRTGIETGLFTEDFPNYAEETEEYSVTEAEENALDFSEATDENGNVLTETLFEDGCFGAFYRSFAYSDNKNDRIAETDTRGFTTNYEVDSCNSRVTAVTDKCGNIKTFEYNKDGKVSKITEKDSEGNTLAEVSVEYDLNGNVTKVTRGDNKEYTFTYNNMGLITNSDGIIYTYRSTHGGLKSVEHKNGHKCTLTYDRFGRLIHEVWTSPNENDSPKTDADYLYAYDRSGNLVSSIDMIRAKEYNYIYEDGALSRMRTLDLTISDGTIVGRQSVSSIRFTYNNDGSVKKKEYTSTGFKEYFRYPDDRDTVKKYLYKNLLSEFHSSTDRFGRRMTEELRTKNKLFFRKFAYLEGQITPTHEEKGKVASFPETNLVKKIDYSNGRSIAYEYDNEGRIISCNDSTSSPKTYAYDAKGQLKSSTTGDATTLYQYDSYGNIVAKGNALSDTEIADDNDKISYVYSDPNHPDRLTQCLFHNGTVMESFNFEYDAQGNPTQYRTIACEWEKGRQLKRFGNCTYRYNPDGMRTLREIVKDVDGEQVLTELYEYEYEGTKLIRQKRLDLESGDSFEIIPLYDNADSPIGIIYDKINDDTFTPRQYWFLKNLQGDVLSLLDEDGVEVVRYNYNDWGQVTIAHDVSGVLLGHKTPFRWRGYEYEEDTTLYYLVTRYYDSKTGRFLNEDDHSFLGASGNTVSYNLYTYCENDPVNNVDPIGRIAISATALAITAGAFLFASLITLTPGFQKAWHDTILTVVLGFQNRLRKIRGITESFVILASSKLEKFLQSIIQNAKALEAKYSCQIEKHHIVAQKAWRAEVGRQILKAVNIKVSNICNIVPIKKSLHKLLHTSLYYGLINGIMVSAYYSSQKEEKQSVIINVLKEIGSLLLSISNNI